MEDIKNIIESLLFVAQEPLTVDRFKKILEQAETGEIRQTLEEISVEFEARKGGFYLDRVAGGYQVRSRPEYSTWIKKLLQPKPFRLSKAALETLAIIAYKQPVIRSDVEHVRGVDCGGVLKVLLERRFIRVMGRKEIPGRPLIYGTTRRFLEVFGLETLKDLPTPKEIEELGDAPLETVDEISGEDSREADALQSDDTATDENRYDSSMPEDEIREETASAEDIRDDDIESDDSGDDELKNT
ncbi:MAG: SMC-Scp complex subunit ScpB [Deltaproteobacteria bacterium]|jgi:segregation and condensation protein B|nr:SMC-Scp complex subunit ScpB [Deltaproteobacteria bacterium]